MSGERYTERAVEGVASYLATNLPTYLRATETTLGLVASSLTDPLAYIRADMPFDHRSPRVDVFEQSWSVVDNRNDVVEVDCTVVLSFVGDADADGGELKMRRYLTALLRCIRADQTLGGTVEAAWLTDGSSIGIPAAATTIRHAFAQGVAVRLHEP